MVSYHHLTLSALLLFTVASKLVISTTETGIACPDVIWSLVIVVRDRPWGQRSSFFLDMVWADWPTQLDWIRVATGSQLEVPARKGDAMPDYPSSDQEIRQDLIWTRCALATAFWRPAPIDLNGPGSWCRDVPNSDKVCYMLWVGCSGHLLTYVFSVGSCCNRWSCPLPGMDEPRHYRNFPTTHTFGGIQVERSNGGKHRESAPGRMSGMAPG